MSISRRVVATVPVVCLLAIPACGNGPAVTANAPPAAGPPVPVADYHQHILSPAAAEHQNEPPLPPVELPEELARVLRARERGWNDEAALAPLYTEDSVVFGWETWARGREDAAEQVGERFAREYRMTPIAYEVDGSAAHVAGYFTRGEGEEAKHFGHFLLALRKGGDGAWRIASEMPSFPGPRLLEPSTAEQVIAQLDDAGIQRGVVLSGAYWFGSPRSDPVPDELAKTRAENDYVAREVAKFPRRLVGFCSFNPLKDYALAELERCAQNASFKGVKLHFGNSDADVKNAEHLEKMRRVFRAANEKRLAIVAHLWTDPKYGSAEAEVFLEKLLPEAPDVTVQIAHFAGGGPGYTDPALEVFAKAIAAGDPRTKNLYFDIATVADDQRPETLKAFAERIRQVGPERVLYGTDLAPPNPAPREAWAKFRSTVALTEEEIRTIAGNVAPYLRTSSPLP